MPMSFQAVGGTLWPVSRSSTAARNWPRQSSQYWTQLDECKEGAHRVTPLYTLWRCQKRYKKAENRWSDHSDDWPLTMINPWIVNKGPIFCIWAHSGIMNRLPQMAKNPTLTNMNKYTVLGFYLSFRSANQTFDTPQGGRGQWSRRVRKPTDHRRWRSRWGWALSWFSLHGDPSCVASRSAASISNLSVAERKHAKRTATRGFQCALIHILYNFMTLGRAKTWAMPRPSRCCLIAPVMLCECCVPSSAKESWPYRARCKITLTSACMCGHCCQMDGFKMGSSWNWPSMQFSRCDLYLFYHSCFAWFWYLFWSLHGSKHNRVRSTEGSPETSWKLWEGTANVGRLKGSSIQRA